MNILTGIITIIGWVGCVVLLIWHRRIRNNMRNKLNARTQQVRQLLAKEINQTLSAPEAPTLGHFHPYRGYVIKAVPTTMENTYHIGKTVVWEPHIFDNDIRLIDCLPAQATKFSAIEAGKQYIDTLLKDDTNTENTEPAKPQG